jgi:hypothetical protein
MTRLYPEASETASRNNGSSNHLAGPSLGIYPEEVYRMQRGGPVPQERKLHTHSIYSERQSFPEFQRSAVGSGRPPASGARRGRRGPLMAVTDLPYPPPVGSGAILAITPDLRVYGFHSTGDRAKWLLKNGIRICDTRALFSHIHRRLAVECVLSPGEERIVKFQRVNRLLHETGFTILRDGYPRWLLTIFLKTADSWPESAIFLLEHLNRGTWTNAAHSNDPCGGLIRFGHFQVGRPEIDPPEDVERLIHCLKVPPPSLRSSITGAGPMEERRSGT